MAPPATRCYFSNSAAAAAAAAFFSGVDALVDPPPVVNSPIKHVVLLMLENRAFDHYFGWASEEMGVDGLTGNEKLPTSTKEKDPKWVNVSKNAPYINVCDPCHGLPCTTQKIFGQKQVDSGHLVNSSMIGFVEEESSHDSYCNVVDMFTIDKIPVVSTLAKEFAIMDRFFCSVPGPTWPNRMFQLCATSSGQTETGVWYHDEVGHLFPTRTIFDQVEENNMTWRNYHNDTPWELFLEKIAFSHEEVRPMGEFFRDAAEGRLPEFAWLNPSSGMDLETGLGSNDQHPDHDVRVGEMFIKDIYEAVRNSPQWNETLFIITYDEHGGFFDHVSPPAAPPPLDHEKSYPDKFDFDRLGVRIPVVLASPWIPKGTVISSPPEQMKRFENSEYDATSILSTARRLLGIPNEFLSERDAWSASFDHVISRTFRTDTPRTLPDPPKPTPPEIEYEANLPINGLQGDMLHHLALLVGEETAPNLRTQAEFAPYMKTKWAQHRERVLHYHAHGSVSLEVVPGGTKTHVLETGWTISKSPKKGLSLITVSSKALRTSRGWPFCLEADKLVKGALVTVKPCFQSADPSKNLRSTQHWSWPGDATFRPSNAQNLCLTTPLYGSGSRSKAETEGNFTSKVYLQPCSGDVSQHWAYHGSYPGEPNAGGELMFGDDLNGLAIVGESSSVKSLGLQWTEEANIEFV